MHAATCANCGKACEVPFKPAGDKPVYCKDCFGGKGGHSADGGFHKKSRSFDATPTWKGTERPAFVPTSNSQKSEGSGMATKQLEMVNAKLEVLISAVEKLTTAMTKKSEVAEVVALAVEKPEKMKLTRKTK
jgi:CxxC-x17-CxxC domain-containing protein